MIYYRCPDNTRPCGGTRRLYGHVDYLNEEGIDAAIVHDKPGFRLSWYENNTRIEKKESVKSGWICFPEIYGDKIISMFSHMDGRKVIMNLSAFLMWENHDFKSSSVYKSKKIAGVMTTTTYTTQALEFAFGKEVTQITPCIKDVFSFSEKKEKILFYMSRRNMQFISNTLNALKQKGSLEGWQLKKVHGLPQDEAAEIMRRSALFLCAGGPEGIQLPPLEAVRSGCTVVGHHGYGGLDYADKLSSFVPIEMNDYLSAAKALDEHIQGWNEEGNDFMLEQRKESSEYVGSVYNKENEKRDVVNFWRHLIGI